jgi:hypothetical protein
MAKATKKNEGFSFWGMFPSDNRSRKLDDYLWWSWESVIHHMYFLVLFVMRQFSETPTGWKLNLEKECLSFVTIFGGDETGARNCAERSMLLFGGLWFKTPDPTEEELMWVGRMVINYQHSEGIFHFWICLTGVYIAYCYACAGKPDDANVPTIPYWARWSAFLSMYVEVWIMCVPYLFVFWWPFGEGFAYEPRHGVLEKVAATSDDPFIDGIHLGAVMLSFLVVSIWVLYLDFKAMCNFWNNLHGDDVPLFVTITIYAIPSAIFAALYFDFHSVPPGGGIDGFGGPLSLSVFGGLHDFYPISIGGVTIFR